MTPQEILSTSTKLLDAKAIIDFTDVLYSFPDNQTTISLNEVRDCFSSGQIISKIWLTTMLNQQGLLMRKNVIICGGWFGTLSRLILEASYGSKVTSLDIDPRCKVIAERFNRQYKDIERFDAVEADMYSYDYTPFDVIVNTSSEHIPSISNWIEQIPKGRSIVLQSNNAFDVPDHVNCVNSVQELVEKTGLTKVFFAEQLVFPMYTRYMVGGVVT